MAAVHHARQNDRPATPSGAGLAARAIVGAVAAAIACVATIHYATANGPPEPPIFAAALRSGAVPPVAKRLPDNPRVVDLPAMGRENGRYGGVWRMFMGDQRDIRMMTIYGYARMVGFDTNGELQPDILESYDIHEGRIFTLKLRRGHKWSDGKPFTSEDFRYYWEDVANNPRLSPSGPSAHYLVDDAPPKFEVIDEVTVRFTWKAPNPAFLPQLAGAQPLAIAMPAHYLKTFHERYAKPEDLAAAVKRARVRDWGSLHERLSRQYRPENPDLPVLDPWRNRTAPPSELFVFERNPYFHRVDGAGTQLPYIDKVTLSMGSTSLIPAKVAAGGADLQARYLPFDSYTFLKQNEKLHNYVVRLWPRGDGARVAILPNLNTGDDVWRALVRDVRFRRALSLGIDRRKINQVVYFGLARESADTVLPQSALYEPSLAAAWTQHDPQQANRLLDEVGLDKRDSDGVRLLPDGRRAEVTVDSSGESSDEIDVLELVGHDWAKIGLRLFPRTAQRDVFRRRILAGQTVFAVWQGIDNAVPGPDMEPEALAPTRSHQYHWPLWGQFFETRGAAGKKPDLDAAVALAELHQRWRSSVTRAEREAIWRKMLAIYADEVFAIGLVNGTFQPVVVSERMRNVPEKAVYSFEPGAFFGTQMPDTFWYSEIPAQE